MRPFKIKKIIALIIAQGTFFTHNAQAEWLEYNLDSGVSKMLAQSNSCEYRLNYRFSETNSLGTARRSSYLPFSQKTQSISADGASNRISFAFTVDRSLRYELTSFIPISGRLSWGGVFFAGSHKQADYLNYLSEAENKNYDCELELTRTSSLGRIVPLLTCTRTDVDYQRVMTFVLDPRRAILQESCS